MRLALLIILASSFLTSCVSARKYQELEAQNGKLYQETAVCLEKVTRLGEENEELNKRLAAAEEQIKALVDDTASFGNHYRRMKQQNKDLNELYEKVIQQNRDLLMTSSAQNQKLSIELENKKRELEIRESELKNLESSLKIQRAYIDSLRFDLQERETRVAELEDKISEKDKAVESLKDRINNALLGFSDKDLQVEVRNGKIYVSLSEKLLFKSGSSRVDSKGEDAIAKLAGVLVKNPDIHILIEGHTDNVPIRSPGTIKDNWDLSVIRATAIVRILTKNKVDPARVTAAGRGEHQSVADNQSSEGRSKNRRTEIILTPNLDDLFELLDTTPE
jgi:chemotaxis protein MotB